MKSLNTIVSALVACVGLVGLAEDAHATSYKIVVDCHGTNGAPTWAYTSDEITIGIVYLYEERSDMGTFELESRAEVAKVKPISTKCDSEDEISVTTFDVENLDRFVALAGVYLSTSGKDSFFADQVKLKTSSNVQLAVWGKDDNTGYCFSTESSDGNAYCSNGRVYRSITYPLSNPIR